MPLRSELYNFDAAVRPEIQGRCDCDTTIIGEDSQGCGEHIRYRFQMPKGLLLHPTENAIGGDRVVRAAQGQKPPSCVPKYMATM